MSLKPLLWLCPRNPWPPRDGASVGNVSLLRGVAALGHPIRLVCFPDSVPDVSESVLASELNLESVTFIPRNARTGR
jgi:hypothetical protein